MPEALRAYFETRTFVHLSRDALDIFIVYYVIYRALLVLRGTRAMQIGVGLGMVSVLYVIALRLELTTVLNIMGTLFSSILLIIVVVFQSDIRRALQRVGSRAWFGRLNRTKEFRVIEEVVEAATDLARHRIGALITFEQDANLDEFVGVHKGHTIDAQITKELLVSLFIPEAVNKLHDGSVIIRNFRIAKAGVFFPMPEGRVVDDSFGSRHRAALGITEETDAVVVIVSEERGTISFCFNGNIATNLDGQKLRSMLLAIFSPKVRKSGRKAAKSQREPAHVEAPAARPDSEARPTLEAETLPARISLVAEDAPAPSRRVLRAPSEPPPPLRAPGTTGTPPTVGVAAPRTLKTPTPRTSDDDSPPEGERGNS
jgi:uncharacterized protein (TIGR00159 family)